MRGAWFEEYERLYNEATENGPLAPGKETELCEQANRNVAERYADHADAERKRKREE